jgi:hypothetical protein
MTRGGYGQLNVRKVLLKAHRLSWYIHFGSFPDGLFIRHLCHNPSCCNPSHLLPGTAAQNHEDMRRAGRMFVPEPIKGNAHHSSKLEPCDVIFIYNSELPGVELATRFGVSRSLVSNIRLGKTWKHLTQSK